MIIKLDMLTEIKEDIEKVIYNHCINEGNIINDEGQFNVPLEGHPNVQYTFADINEYGQRSPEEIKRLLFLNDTIKLMYKMHLYINMVDNTNHLPLKQLIEYKLVERDAPPDHEPEEKEEDDIKNKKDDIDQLNETIQDMVI